MKGTIYSVITGTGSYIPSHCIRNQDFLEHEFYNSSGTKLEKSGQEIIDKFQAITTIKERRIVDDNLVTSDIAYLAGKNALQSSGIEKEELDYIILAHNFGDVTKNHGQLDIVPTLAARVKRKLKIRNPETIAYDLPFGCPGWLQAVIQADYFIKSGDASRILVIGADVLSRVIDPHDRDSMLYADGAGAVVLEACSSSTPKGILAHKTRSDTFHHSEMLFMGESYHQTCDTRNELYLKMQGRKLYQYALEHVPQAMQCCLQKSGTDLSEISKLLIHQANGKMDDAILHRLYGLYAGIEIPEDIMPMTVSWLGNSSVATVPTLLDLICKERLDPHRIKEGDTILFASVGAGMNINAVVYKA